MSPRSLRNGIPLRYDLSHTPSDIRAGRLVNERSRAVERLVTHRCDHTLELVARASTRHFRYEAGNSGHTGCKRSGEGNESP